MKDKNLVKFHLFYFMLIGGMGCFFPYINVYLEKTLHLTGSQLGLINSVSLLVGICIMPIWGIIGDKTRKYKSLLLLVILMTMVSLYFYSKQLVYLGVFIMAIILKLSSLPGTSLADTITMNYTKKHGGNYGSIRAMGSLGYVVFSMLVGFLADLYGLDGPMFICYMIGLGIAFLLATSFPNEKVEEEEEKQNVPFMVLFKNNRYLLILLIVMLTQVVVDAAGNYAGNHLTVTLEGSNSMISFYSLIQVFPEVILLMVAGKIIEKLGYRKYMILAFSLMILRMFTYGFVHNPIVFIIVSVVHCFGVGFSSVACLSYIQKTVDQSIYGTALSFFNVAINLGGAIFGYLFGIMYQYLSSYAIFITSGCIICIALVITVFSKQLD